MAGLNPSLASQASDFDTASVHYLPDPVPVLLCFLHFFRWREPFSFLSVLGSCVYPEHGSAGRARRFVYLLNRIWSCFSTVPRINTTYHFVEDLNALSEFLPSVRHRVALPSAQHLALLRLKELPNVQVIPAPPPPIASLLWLEYENVWVELGGWEVRQSTGGMCAVIYQVMW